MNVSMMMMIFLAVVCVLLSCLVYYYRRLYSGLKQYDLTFFDNKSGDESRKVNDQQKSPQLSQQQYNQQNPYYVAFNTDNTTTLPQQHMSKTNDTIPIAQVDQAGSINFDVPVQNGEVDGETMLKYLMEKTGGQQQVDISKKEHTMDDSMDREQLSSDYQVGLETRAKFRQGLQTN